MTRIFGHYVSLEMAGLFLLDLVLSFFVIRGMLPPLDLVNGVGTAWVAGVEFAVSLAGTIGATALTIGLYRPEVCLDWRRLLINAAVAGVLAFPAALVVGVMFNITLSHAFLVWLIEVLVAWVACLVLLRWGFRMATRQDALVRRVLVLGSGARATRAAGMVRAQRGRFFQLAGLGSTVAEALDEAGAPPPPAVTTDGPTLYAALRARNIWGVIIAPDGPDTPPLGALLHCKLRGIRVIDDVGFWEQHLGRIDLDNVDARWFLAADGFSNGWLSTAIKRLSDLTVSVTILLLTLPLMLLTALAVKLDSPGPVFYRQQRVGLHGRPFTVLKFRSMTVNAEAAGRAVWAQRKDPRVTRVGGFIRLTRIDELPQLLNVLQGAMSFIGPRPERPHFVEQLMQVIPFYAERSTVKPGITGWAQVNYPYGASVEDAREKLSYDLYYVKNRSVFLDLLILLATVRVILFQEGAR
jgi:sugar transferase (PEP-CTERM system associated)